MVNRNAPSRHRPPTPPDTEAVQTRRRQVLTKAVVKAAGLLGMQQRDLAAVLGVSEATVSRMKEATYAVDGKPFELAALLVRVHRSLDALLGGNQEGVRIWFHAHNAHLQGTPSDLVRQALGLVRVAEYLDAMRGAL